MNSSQSFLSRMQSTRPLLADGAMGTLLYAHGIRFDQCFDELLLSNPELVAEIHRDYIQAGAQLIKTNTFGANRFKLSQHGLEDKVNLINRFGVELAQRVVSASFKGVFIAGDVGPLGVRLAPFGRVQPEQARQVFSEQIGALQHAGVDLILIETMTDLCELREAIRAARQVAAGLPVVASMTFTRDDTTLLGDSAEKVACGLAEAGADVIGINCSSGPAQLLRILKQMRQAVPGGVFSVMPNAGWPEQIGGRIMYPAAAEYFGEYALSYWQAGASMVGGCCGTTPQHIHAMHKALDKAPAGALYQGVNLAMAAVDETLAPSEQPTRLAQKLASGKFVIAAEVDPPRGLSTHKLLAGASLLAEAGVDVIDVADSPMARMRMSPWAVCSLIQNRTDIETVLHFPTRGRNMLRVQGDLLAAHALGVRNVFVVMGDPTSIGDYPNAMDNYDLVPSGLIKLIKQHLNAGEDQAGSGIGQPTSFFVGCALNVNAPNLEDEIKNLHRKLRAGADYVLTQPVFETGAISRFRHEYEKVHGPLNIPVLAGILPLVSSRHAAFLNHEVPGITIPEVTYQRMTETGENATGTGVKIAIELVEAIRPIVQGVYLMPAFSRFDLTAEIIEAVVKSQKQR